MRDEPSNSEILKFTRTKIRNSKCIFNADSKYDLQNTENSLMKYSPLLTNHVSLLGGNIDDKATLYQLPGCLLIPENEIPGHSGTFTGCYQDFSGTHTGSMSASDFFLRIGL